MSNSSRFTRRELVYQLLFLVVAAVFYIFDREGEVVDLGRIPSFLLFAILAIFVGYVLLPTFFYKKKYIQFFIYLLLTVFAAIYLEEFVVEKIFYPDTRGSHFHGLFSSLLEIIPILLLLVSFKFAWDLYQKNKAIEQLQSTARESELRFLKSQINPHFLFNNLNNLYSYSITDPDRISDLILQLSSSMRYMLYDCQADEVDLQKELQHLSDFVSLNQLQVEDRGHVSLVINNESSGYDIAPLILSVFIENAFKHSTASMSDGIEIMVQIDVSNEGKLHFICKNRYQETSNVDHLSYGIGLSNVRKRLNLVYPDSHHLAMKENGWYIVDLRIQLSQRTS